jgi:hypothetical protein
MQDGDAEGKLLGYVIALEGQSAWALERAVRLFLKGEVAEHNGRFLPTSAELARVVRAEADFVRGMQLGKTKKSERDPPSPEARARIVAKADALIAQLNRTAAGDKLKAEMASGVRKQLEAIAANARKATA